MIRVVLLLALTVQCACGECAYFAANGRDCVDFVYNQNYLPVADVYNDGCDLGWLEFDGFCYSFNVEPAAWYLALSVCHAVGARLVQIDSQAKSDWIIAQAKRDGADFFWTGGTDSLHEGIWEWIPSKKPVWNFQKWMTRQPDNTKQAENCLIIQKPDYWWNDYSCSSNHRFICEKRARFLQTINS